MTQDGLLLLCVECRFGAGRPHVSGFLSVAENKAEGRQRQTNRATYFQVTHCRKRVASQ